MLRSIRDLLVILAALAPASAVVAEPGRASAETAPEQAAPAESGWTVKRVGGDLEVKALWDEKRGMWRSGPSYIDTPLPEGYPAPTPPGAIDLKRYPTVRRAEIGSARGNGFMPLFRHIERNGIEMTSPVEMDYREGTSLREARMSFLYRTQDLHPTGADPKDQRIAIVDTEPLTVVSIGGRGSYETDRVQRDTETLMRWLDENPEWEAAGAPRALMYNGPTLRPWTKWIEVQVPVRREKAKEPRKDESARTAAEKGPAA